MTVAAPKAPPAVTPFPLVPVAPTAGPEPYRLSVAQYHEMGRHGILKEGERVELLEGLLATKMTIHQPHTYATGVLQDDLPRIFSGGFVVLVQQPITTTDSEPEPDIAVARGTRRFFLAEDRHPIPAEVPLVVEVADSSLAEDRGVKARIYARAGLVEFWIVNIPDRIVEVYTDPDSTANPPQYRFRRDYAVGGEVPVRLDGVEVGRVRVAELFR